MPKITEHGGPSNFAADDGAEVVVQEPIPVVTTPVDDREPEVQVQPTEEPAEVETDEPEEKPKGRAKK